jgi:hypothetical protein
MAQRTQSDERLDSATLSAIWQVLVGVNTAMPGVIVAFDAATQRASVQPCNKVVMDDDTESLLPVLQDVPCFFPGVGNFFLTHPVNVDDPCLLVVAQRSLDNWLTSGEPEDPQSNRKFSMNDAVAFFGIQPTPLLLDPPPSQDGIELRTRDQGTFLRVTDGAIRILGDVVVDGTVYATDCIAQVTPATQVALSTHTQPTGMGPTGAPVPTPGVAP